MEYLLQANSVSKKYGDFTALNNVSIAVEKGSCFWTSRAKWCRKNITHTHYQSNHYAR